MDAAHPLLEPVGVPGDVVVEEDVAALEVDALAGGLGGDENLDGAVLELLLGVEPRPGSSREPVFMLPWMQPTRKPHARELLDEVVERVLELGEDQQPLVGMVEEALRLEQSLQA